MFRSLFSLVFLHFPRKFLTPPMPAALRSKPSRDAALSAVSQFKYFVFNYMHTAQVTSSHYTNCTKSDDLFMNTPYHFTSFKPMLLGGNFVEKGSQIFDHPRASQSVSKNSDKNWGHKLSSSRCNTVVESASTTWIWLRQLSSGAWW